MKVIVVILSFVITYSIFSQSPDTLYPVNVYINDEIKYGYINREGNIVIEPIYFAAQDFSEGLAFVKIDKISDLWACINSNNEIIFTINSDYFSSGYSEGLALISHNNKYYYIDKTGKNAFDKSFFGAKNFRSGFAIVNQFSGYKKNAVINKNGVVVFDTLLYFCSDFNYGYAKIRNDTTNGFIDTNWNVTLIDTSYHFAYTTNENRNVVCNFVPVEVKNKVGYIDLKGNIVINPIFDKANDFYEGLASVSLGGKWGFIDTTWKLVIAPQFSRAGCYSEGLAPVNVTVSINGSYNAFINKAGNIVIRDTIKYDNMFFDGYRENEIFLPKPFKNGICNYSSSVFFTIFERYVRSDGKFIWVRDLLDE